MILVFSFLSVALFPLAPTILKPNLKQRNREIYEGVGTIIPYLGIVTWPSRQAERIPRDPATPIPRNDYYRLGRVDQRQLLRGWWASVLAWTVTWQVVLLRGWLVCGITWHGLVSCHWLTRCERGAIGGGGGAACVTLQILCPGVYCATGETCCHGNRCTIRVAG